MHTTTAQFNNVLAFQQPQDRSKLEQPIAPHQKASSNFDRRSRTESTEAVNALDLIESGPIAPDTFKEIGVFIQQNFGVEFEPAKWKMLKEVITRDGWSEERFRRTAEWFMKNQRFSAWTIADWYSFSVKCYTLSGKNKLIAEGHKAEEFEAYKLPDGNIVWKLIDGQTLPFPKCNLKELYEARFDDLAATLDRVFPMLERGTAEGYWKWFFDYGHYVDYLPEPRRTEYTKRQTAIGGKFGEKKTWGTPA
jgi:hypothetical protein